MVDDADDVRALYESLPTYENEGLYWPIPCQPYRPPCTRQLAWTLAEMESPDLDTQGPELEVISKGQRQGIVIGADVLAAFSTTTYEGQDGTKKSQVNKDTAENLKEEQGQNGNSYTRFRLRPRPSAKDELPPNDKQKNLDEEDEAMVDVCDETDREWLEQISEESDGDGETSEGEGFDENDDFLEDGAGSDYDDVNANDGGKGRGDDIGGQVQDENGEEEDQVKDFWVDVDEYEITDEIEPRAFPSKRVMHRQTPQREAHRW